MNKKSISDAKVSANRRNAEKSSGPKNTSSTRFNATKHGLRSAGITELDDADGYRDTLRRLSEGYSDELDTFLVRRIALYMVRLQRTARLEAEFITSVLHPPIYGDLFDFKSLDRPVLEPGLPASIGSDTVQALVSTYQRYESADENKLYRAINQLERIRRMRQGEQLPAPAALDVGVHSESSSVDSNGAVPNLVLEGSRIDSVYPVREACTQSTNASAKSEQHSSDGKRVDQSD